MQEEILDTQEKQKKGIMEYDFMQLDERNFDMTLTVYSHNRLMKMILNKCKPRLKRKGVDITKTDGQLEKIYNFAVIPQYYKLMKMAIRKLINKINIELDMDGRLITNYEVIYAMFRRDKKYNEIWCTDIKIQGQFHERRYS